MSIGNILSIARSAINANQRGLDVTGQNIANAATPGYSRQRVGLTAATPFSRLPFGYVPQGVSVESVERARDLFLDGRYRRESATLSWFETMRDGLAGVEAVLGEPSDAGLAATLDAFWNAWSDVANSPSDPAARVTLQRQGDQLAGTLNRLDERFAALQTETVGRIDQIVAQVNAITARLAELNVAISTNAGTVPDLLDERDILLDQLSGLVPVTTIMREGGGIAVLSGEFLLVDGGSTVALQRATDPAGQLVVSAEGSSATLGTSAGKLGALLEFLGQGIDDARQRLDAFTASLVEQVNALHRTGTTPAGATNQDFFDATGTGSGTIRLALAVAGSPDAIAAGASAAPGDGAIALSLAALRDAGIPALNGSTLGEYFTTLVADVGVSLRDADESAAAHDVLLANIDSQRASISGVSVDEEMINLITYQQAFAAAARLINVADELMQDLMRMV